VVDNRASGRAVDPRAGTCTIDCSASS